METIIMWMNLFRGMCWVVGFCFPGAVQEKLRECMYVCSRVKIDVLLAYVYTVLRYTVHLFNVLRYCSLRHETTPLHSIMTTYLHSCVANDFVAWRNNPVHATSYV